MRVKLLVDLMALLNGVPGRLETVQSSHVLLRRR